MNESDKRVNDMIKIEKRLTDEQRKFRWTIIAWKSDVQVTASLFSHAEIITSGPKETEETLKDVAERREKLEKEFGEILKKHNATLADVKKVLTKFEWDTLPVPPKYQKEKEKLG